MLRVPYPSRLDHTGAAAAGDVADAGSTGRPHWGIPLSALGPHGGRAEDAFDLVLPSFPGYGFSADTARYTGWGPNRIGRAWDEPMGRLGYERYMAQGGDWSLPGSVARAGAEPLYYAQPGLTHRDKHGGYTGRPVT